MSSGHGYGNVGDEAQCSACISRWRKVVPNCKITLFSPNPGFTEALHKEQCEWAPRVLWFRSNTIGPYDGNTIRFKIYYKWIYYRLIISAYMIKMGLPLLLCNENEARVLHVIFNHDILHITGGGFLTGRTRSRLWENCLLMRLCKILDIPYFLTGHTIGVFQNKRDKHLAKIGLKHARYIGLRDHGISEKELKQIGINGNHIQSTCDDALLLSNKIERGELKNYVTDAGIDWDKPWAAVNFHHWGQKDDQIKKTQKRFAQLCDHIIKNHGLQILFVAMTPTDVEPEVNIKKQMRQRGINIPYNANYEVVRAIIAHANLVVTLKHHPIVFAQGEGVPVIAISFDDYYYHKNKGALDNTGHGRYIINKYDYFTNNIFKKINEVINSTSQIKNDMQCWLHKMMEIEYYPYNIILEELLFSQETIPQKIVIIGAGAEGLNLLKLSKKAYIEVEAFTDKNPTLLHKKLDGIPIIPLIDGLKMRLPIVISSMNIQKQILKEVKILIRKHTIESPIIYNKYLQLINERKK